MEGQNATGSFGIRFVDTGTITITDFSWTSHGGRGITTTAAGAGSDVTISGGTFDNADGDIVAGLIIYSTVAIDVDAQDITVSDFTNSDLFYLSHAGSTLYCRNNDYQSGFRVVNIAEADNLDSDFNHFGAENQRNTVEGSAYTTITAYRSGTGQDANSTVG